jgi:lipopolysaccharide transport system ATP-binding protein
VSQPIIKVEGLSKCYQIGHQNRENYSSFRDALTGNAKALCRRVFTPWRPRTTGGSVEEFWALNNVSFNIAQGERVGIIGRNGAGKSTLLKILSRISEPTHGRISLGGRVASLLEVGTGFHPELTGRENIFLNGAILGMSKAEIQSKFHDIVAFSETEKFLDTPVKRYSSGMYVRLAFAVAAHLDPEILIVDEVLAVGDQQFQKKCLGKMGEVASGGRTVLFVSHNMQSIRRLCSTAILLDRGRARRFSNVEDAINAYSNGMQSSPFEVELQNAPRRNGWGDYVKLIRCALAPQSSFTFGQPLELIFTLQCLSTVRHLVIGVAFDTQDGARVLTLDTDIGHRPFEVQAGTIDVRVSIDKNPLHPGNYNIGAAVFSRNDVIDCIPNIATWNVEADPNDIVATRGYGACRLPVSVSVGSITPVLS